MAATPNPINGDTSNVWKTLLTCDQSTPLVPDLGDISWFAMPTPMIEPTIVCELDAGRPSHHVPRFQSMAANSSAKTIAKPAPLPTCRISSTGSSVIMLKATAPFETRTPAKFSTPEYTTAMCGSRECV